MATATKTSLENKHLGNGDYFVFIAFSSHPLLLTGHAANGLVEERFKHEGALYKEVFPGKIEAHLSLTVKCAGQIQNGGRFEFEKGQL